MSNIKHKAEIEYFKSYTWDKVCYDTFISRVLRNKIPLEVAILPWIIEKPWRNLKEKWKEHRDSDPVTLFYNNYQWEKVWFRYFQEKLRAWMPMEDAIKKECKRLDYLKGNKNKKPKKTPVVTISDSLSNYYIEVTYTKEEASVIRNVYIERIDDNEDKMLSCEPSELTWLIKETDQLKKELEVFNKWNPV